MLKKIPNKIIKFIQRLESLPVTKLYQLDAILSDLANHIYDIREHISEMSEKAILLGSKQRLDELTNLNKELMSLYKLLVKMEYDSHYMNRALHTLGYVLEDLKKMLESKK